MSDIMNNKLKTWRFAYDNDNQIKRVLLGWQTATTYLYNEKNTPNNYEEVLVFDNEKKACITKTLKIIITEFKNIDENLSKLEEDDFVNWQQTHINYFKSVNPNFDKNTKVVFKIFEVKDGTIFSSEVTGILPSKDGSPGEKQAEYDKEDIKGTVSENTKQGIFGKYTDEILKIYGKKE